MNTYEVRDKYLNFFNTGVRGHKKISSSSLVPEDDPTTLFTSSGMQPLVPYLMGEVHPEGKRLVNSQPSIRVQDIEEVGDNRHTTFFEMLGNWSLGDYFKEEQLNWFFEFLTKEIGLPKERLSVSVFEGNGSVERDDESGKIWEKIGIPKSKIYYYGVKDNWWSRSGPPDLMPTGEIGGPDSEVFFEFPNIKHDSKFGKECGPSCDCGRFLEIGNSVFIQYIKEKNGALNELPNKNVDFGGGLERLTAAVNDDADIFKIDAFSGFISDLEKATGIDYGSNKKADRSIRIVADHTRAATMLLREGVVPSNKQQGYVLRRLIRRAVFHFKILHPEQFGKFTGEAIDRFENTYSNFDWSNKLEIQRLFSEESNKFEKALERGTKKLNNAIIKNTKIDGNFVFDLYQSEGFPLDLTIEILEKEGRSLTDFEKKSFEIEFEKHRNASRTASSGMFKGGLADKSIDTVKLHTATHLLNWALGVVLGNHVVQKGSNITSDRLRFDFSHDTKLTDEELLEVEKLINEKIDKSLPVGFEMMDKEDALKTGAVHTFGEKYGEKVKVYYIGDNIKDAFSKEFCGGPHVENTKEIGNVKISKQKKVGTGLIRLYAEIS